MTSYIISSKLPMTEDDIVKLDLGLGNCPAITCLGIDVRFASHLDTHPFHSCLAEVLSETTSSLRFTDVNGEQLAKAFGKYVSLPDNEEVGWDSKEMEEMVRLVNTIIRANWKVNPLRHIYYIYM